MIRNWAPLGYNLRAVRLHEIARQAVQRHGGRLPDTLAGLLALKGIGPYTAGAVACFAFGLPVAALDTNVRRVLGRLFAQEAPGASEDDRLAWRLAEAALPPADAYDWNQALMDLGATICVARSPRCLLCPVQSLCSARAAWDEQDVPPASLARVAERRGAYGASARASGAPPAPLRGLPALVPGPHRGRPAGPPPGRVPHPGGPRGAGQAGRRAGRPGVAPGSGAGPRP